VRVLVVVESMFGNTYSVGSSIVDGLRAVHPSVTADLMRVGDVRAADVVGVDVLVVGVPTHWFGIPSQRTQHQYLRDTDVAASVTRIGTPIDPSAAGIRVRDWLGTLAHVDAGRAAAFDTRLARPFSGGAAPRLARRLTRLGYTLTGEPTGFIVTGMEGPLRAGERDRARRWGHQLIAPLLA
jgi:hypothetical protein